MPLKVANFLLPLLFATSSFALPENALRTEYANTLLPFMATAKTFTFNTTDGLALSAVSFVNPKSSKTIVIVNGRSEPWLKYAEIFYDLYAQGYSIYSYDHRGQGLSPHLSSHNPQIGHVDHFSSYIQDLNTFVTTVVEPAVKPGDELFLLAHSMGGAVSAGYLSEFKTPFKKAILSCPMLSINTAPYKEIVAKSIVELYILVGKGSQYAKGKTDYDINTPFSENTVTSSEPRWWMTNEVYRENPSTLIGGPSSKWVLENINGSHHVRKEMKHIEIPFLMFQAGKDQLVNPSGEITGCTNAGKNCTLVQFPESQHEVLMESDAIRNAAFEKISTYFQ